MTTLPNICLRGVATATLLIVGAVALAPAAHAYTVYPGGPGYVHHAYHGGYGHGYGRGRYGRGGYGYRHGGYHHGYGGGGYHGGYHHGPRTYAR